MCGIAGYKTDRPVPEHVIKDMLKALYHRGPDALGFYSSGNYHAGMRRLMINDLKTGNQPLFNQDQSISLLYNGEIYNSPELRIVLEQKGYRFRTRSDGEVICHLYEEYGEGLFEHLDGMFAVALWSELDQKLILARDIPGEKPLYYYQLNDWEIVFASEIKSLVRFPGLNLDINFQGIWDFPTFTWIPEPNTIYRNIKSLPRSHFLVVDRDGIQLKQYANWHQNEEMDILDEDVVSETRRVVEEAVKSRLLSDVDVGCFLSSGLDSSIVATIARKSLNRLSTFTIGFEDISDPFHGKADESVHAEAYAKELGTDHHTIRVKAEDFSQVLNRMCQSMDQPFAVPSGMGIMEIARAAKEQGVKVLLTGDCADECFGGYSWYFHLNENGHDYDQSNEPRETVGYNNLGMDLNSRLATIQAYSPQKQAWAWHYYASESEKANLFNQEAFEGVVSSLKHFENFNSSQHWTPEQFVKQDRNFYLLNEMLQKVDRMTMTYSVEARVPFAAPKVLAHAEKLKYKHMVRGNYLKWALREAFRDILPKQIYQRSKHGFNVPIDNWLQNEWNDLFEETFASSSQLTKFGVIDKNSRDFANRMIHNQDRLNGSTIFSFIVLNKWLEENESYRANC